MQETNGVASPVLEPDVYQCRYKSGKSNGKKHFQVDRIYLGGKSANCHSPHTQLALSVRVQTWWKGNEKEKIALPPQYTTWRACGSCGGGGADGVSAGSPSAMASEAGMGEEGSLLG